MSTKSGHDLEPAQQAGKHHHHHGDGHGHKHHGDHNKHNHGDGKHHHADKHHQHGDHHHHGDGKHHHGDHHHKHPNLRDAVIKAGDHGRPRAGTLPRKESNKHHKGHEHDRQSVGRHSESHPPAFVEYENTYKMSPDARFQQGTIREIIATVLKENLTESEYDPRVMSRRCLELSDVIKERVKQLDMQRFKIVCMVMIGQNTDQSLMVSSRCLWNFNFDNYSSFTLKKEPFYAVGMVFATYME